MDLCINQALESHDFCSQNEFAVRQADKNQCGEHRPGNAEGGLASLSIKVRASRSFISADSTRISAARSRQCFASYIPWSVMDCAPLAVRRERTLSLSHRRPWLIDVFSAGDVLTILPPRFASVAFPSYRHRMSLRERTRPGLGIGLGIIEPCLPSPAKAPPPGASWLHELKHDGMRIMARRECRCSADHAGRATISRPAFRSSSRRSQHCPGAQVALSSKTKSSEG